MILDTLSNAKRYATFHSLFVQAFDTLLRKDLDSLAPGRHPVLDDRIYLVIARGEGVRAEEGRLEAHRRYIDIQYVIGGKDTIGWKHAPDCSRVDQAYDSVKDIEFFYDRPVLWTSVMPGMFTIFFPEDAHAPMVGEGTIHKAVIKVAI